MDDAVRRIEFEKIHDDLTKMYANELLDDWKEIFSIYCAVQSECDER